MKVKIIGAGSIGNPHAFACREMGWDVTMVDTDPAALTRMKEDLYPKRYGSWDEGITLETADAQTRGGFDIIYFGTPPHIRLALATKALEENPKVIQLEKPLCPPTEEAMAELREFMEAMKRYPDTKVIVGFNHLVAKNTSTVEEAIARAGFGKLLSLEAGVRSDWSGILGAHPWLSGPQETYLGFWKKGGGSGGEHSHALNLWQHFAHHAGAGRVREVNALIEYVQDGAAEYDRHFFVQLTTENGLVGRVVQDVVTKPKKKWVELQFERGRIEWWNDVTTTLDEVLIVPSKGEIEKISIEKTRTEEFKREAEHIHGLIDGSIAYENSPLRFMRGADTSIVLEAAHRSQKERATVTVQYP